MSTLKTIIVGYIANLLNNIYPRIIIQSTVNPNH